MSVSIPEATKAANEAALVMNSKIDEYHAVVLATVKGLEKTVEDFINGQLTPIKLNLSGVDDRLRTSVGMLNALVNKVNTLETKVAALEQP
jgi:hypothetical protein